MSESKIEYKVKIRTIDKQSKFVLIGNGIDGFVNIGLQEFDGFEDLQQRFPALIEGLRFYGEWNVTLYQVKSDCRYVYRWGYYMVPKRGKKLIELTYMNVFDRNAVCFDRVPIQLGAGLTRSMGTGEIEKGRLFVLRTSSPALLL